MTTNPHPLMPRGYVETEPFVHDDVDPRINTCLKYLAIFLYLAIFVYKFGGQIDFMAIYAQIMAFTVIDRIYFVAVTIVAFCLGLPLAKSLAVILHEGAHWIVLTFSGFKVTYIFQWQTLPPQAAVATYNQLQSRENLTAGLLAPIAIVTPLLLISLFYIDNMLLFIYVAEMFAFNTHGSSVDIGAVHWFWKKKQKGTYTLLDKDRTPHTFEPKR